MPQQVDLSDRETDVVRLIAQGYSNREIAAQLGLSVKTVETYKARSMEKLGLSHSSRGRQVRPASGLAAGPVIAVSEAISTHSRLSPTPVSPTPQSIS